MQALYLMLGYPGSGKTTTAKVLHQLTGAEHLWADHFRREWFGNPTYQPDETKMLYERLNDMTEYLLKKGKSVIFDTNFNNYKDRQRLRKMAKACNVDTVIIWVKTSKDIAMDRAVENAHKHHTRILGHMPLESFERLSGNLDPPHINEVFLTVDGTKVTPKYLKSILAPPKT